MKEIVIDASVALKWFYEKDESNADLARQLLQHASENKIKIFAPSLLVLEIINVISRKKGFDPKKLRTLSDRIATLPIIFESFNISELPQVAILINKYKLTSYDSLYLLLAIKKNIQLLTEDRQLLKAGQTIDLNSLADL